MPHCIFSWGRVFAIEQSSPLPLPSSTSSCKTIFNGKLSGPAIPNSVVLCIKSLYIVNNAKYDTIRVHYNSLVVLTTTYLSRIILTQYPHPRVRLIRVLYIYAVYSVFAIKGATKIYMQTAYLGFKFKFLKLSGDIRDIFL